MAQRNSLRLFFAKTCVPVLRAAGCGAAVFGGISEAAQEERGIGNISKNRIKEDKAGLWNVAFVL